MQSHEVTEHTVSNSHGPVVKTPKQVKTSKAGGKGLIPGWEIKIPHAVWCGQKIKKKKQ